MMFDLSSVAREAAGREAERHWPTGREYSTAQTSAVFSVKELDAYCANALVRGFTECASRIPSEEETADVIEGADKAWREYWGDFHAGIGEDPGPLADFISRAVLLLIGEKISGTGRGWSPHSR